MLHEKQTEQIIGCFFQVYNDLGYGFLEKVYENALSHTLKKQGFDVQQQKPISVWYDDTLVGEYFTDLLVNDQIIIELKAVNEIGIAHEAQLVNYLKATECEVGLILNFGPKAEFKRKVKTNQ